MTSERTVAERSALRAPPLVLVTGASGYVGAQLVAALVAAPRTCRGVVAVDVREVPGDRRHAGVRYEVADICSERTTELILATAPDVVVHLAAIVSPTAETTRARQYEVDVEGTRRVLAACVASGVRRIIVSSSGAAYGYHADNPSCIGENEALRGNPEFAYADHKRQVEEMLARARGEHPALEQVVLRLCTVLGRTTRNQITDLFDRRLLIAVRGAASPFSFVWDGDVVACLVRAIDAGPPGVYNLAGDGSVTMQEIADLLGKRCLDLPAWLLRAALAALRSLHMTQYGPEQVNFLRYRPVIDNTRLKQVFGFTPRFGSRTAFERFLALRAGRVDRGIEGDDPGTDPEAVARRRARNEDA